MPLSQRKTPALPTLLVTILLALSPTLLSAQDTTDADDTDKPSEQAGTDWPFSAPHLGFLLQTEARVINESDSPEGFAVRTARLRASGVLGGDRFRYKLQTDLTKSQVLLDAKLSAKVTTALRLEAGVFSAPFSGELLMFRGETPFAERARVVSALAPGRQVGANLHYTSGRLDVQAGVFNGNGGTTLVNDDQNFLGVARATALIPTSSESLLRIGISGGYSKESDLAISSLIDSFSGERVLLGADAELKSRRLYGYAEITRSRFSHDGNVPEDNSPSGFSLTTGYYVFARHQVLVRLDHFEVDIDNIGASNLIVLGYNFFANDFAKAVLNYAYDVEEAATSKLLLRLQFAVK